MMALSVVYDNKGVLSISDSRWQLPLVSALRRSILYFRPSSYRMSSLGTHQFLEVRLAV